MKTPHALRSLLLLLSALLLSGCLGPKTPQEVTEAFWRSVVKNDVQSAVAYSTLTDESNYDAFDTDWSGYQPIWGRVVIEGNEASVESEFVKPGRSEDLSKKFITYLVKKDEKWLVDYARTGKSLRGGPLGELFDRLGKMGDEISRQIGASARDMDQEMERLTTELERYSEELSLRAEESMQQFGETLQQSMNELEESIRRALKEQKEKLSDEDRRTLTEVANDLDEEGDTLSEPTVQSISSSGKSIAEAQVKLSQVNSKAIDNYKRQWQEWAEKFEADMQNLVDSLSAPSNP